MPPLALLTCEPPWASQYRSRTVNMSMLGTAIRAVRAILSSGTASSQRSMAAVREVICRSELRSSALELCYSAHRVIGLCRLRSGGSTWWGRGRPAHDEPWVHHDLAVLGPAAVQPFDECGDGVLGELRRVLADGGEVHVGEPGERAVVVADHRHGARNVDACPD